MKRKVLAYHVTFSTYGFWLPNDPRGSNSDCVRAPHLKTFGEATKVFDRRSHAGDRHDAALRAAAKRALRFPPVCLTGLQAREVGRGFKRCVEHRGYRVLSAAIMPKHVHLVILRHRYSIEQVVGRLKAFATDQLRSSQMHPFQTQSEQSMWGRKLRKIFLFDTAAIDRAVDYVNDNPADAGLPAQHWSFVSPYAVSSATTPSSSLSA